MSYDIENFWKPRLCGQGFVNASPGFMLKGWTVGLSQNPAFIEAGIRLRAGFEDTTAPIWLVAAPGAVGKSTLAKEIAARTGSVYLDLAVAESVAGNYLTGGLFKSNLMGHWQSGNATLLIDALDEARLGVTQNSFDDFISDAVAITNGRSTPLVFFGRMGIIEETWCLLTERGISCPIFDIDFFDREKSQNFIMAALQRLAERPENKTLASMLHAHSRSYQEVASIFVQRLESAAAADGPRFSGYAPVLEAVATSLSRVSNPSSLSDAIQDEKEGEILQSLVRNILEREAGKLREQLSDIIDEDKRRSLYSPQEQIDRLVNALYGSALPIQRISLQPSEETAYENAVKSFMEQHPFLDGTRNSTSGAVFGALINAHAMHSSDQKTVVAAERLASNGPHSPNPFLVDFYLDTAKQTLGEDPIIPPEHVVALYESVRARAQIGEIVRLSIEGDDETDEADVEIQVSVSDNPNPFRRMTFRTSQAGVLRFGRKVNGASIDAPQLDVVVGSGNPVEFVAPVALNVARISFDCPEIVVLRGDQTADTDDMAVVVEARELAASSVSKVPVVRKGTELSLSWENVTTYPWTQYASRLDEGANIDLHDALRLFRKLVMAFRSHSKGRLARYKDKIEHARMTKGHLGTALREKLVADKVLSLEGPMYYLDPDVLGELLGVSYQDVKMRRFGDTLLVYLSGIQ